MLKSLRIKKIIECMSIKINKRIGQVFPLKSIFIKFYMSIST